MFICSVGNTERSSIVSDYRTIQVCIEAFWYACFGYIWGSVDFFGFASFAVIAAFVG
jgi:hypothetical protein